MSIILLSALLATSASALSPTDLKVEYLRNPIGIDDSHPRFFWIDKGNRRNAHQSNYRILVASSRDKLNAGTYDLWDSGKIQSDETTQIPYRGTPLTPGQRAWWEVMVWDADGRPSRESQAGFWELGLPSTSDWHASWISLATDQADPLQIPSPYLRKTFETKPNLFTARAYVTAKGLYELYIDGKKIGIDHLDPGWTDYNKRIQYQTFDIGSALRGRNHSVGLRLGNGWYCGHIGLTGGDNYGKYPEGLVQMELTYRDGQREEIVSDGTWKGHTGAILSDDLLMGEHEDARLEPTGWSSARFDDASWQPVQVKGLGSVPLVAQESPTVQVLEEIRPKAEIPQVNPSVHVVDMGQNMVGWARLKAEGPAGTKIRLRFAEMLSPDKSVYTTNLRGAKATDSFVLSGTGTEILEPSFTTHGFRYVEVTGYPGEFHAGDVTGIVAGSNNPVTGQFSCSSKLVNDLQHNIFWSERGNYLSVPTDCPQRDERLGWMGDAQIFARTACFNNDVAPFMTKWTQDVVDAQSPQGGFSDVSPRKGDPSDGAPAWGDAGVIVPYTIYLCYGDRRLLQERYPAMQRWIEYIDTANPNHIWINRSNNNFGDWLNVNDDTPRDVLATAYFAYSTHLLAESAKVLGKHQDEAKYNALFDEIRDAFNREFVTEDFKVKGDTQTEYVLSLRFNLVPENQRQFAAKRLVDHILIDRRGHLSTGFVGVGYLNPTLTAIGRSDVAYKLLLNDTYPSWGYSIRQGATTIWERWDGWTQQKGFQDPGMNSFNHYSLGSVGEWMYRTVAGIDLDPDVPGYKNIVIRPIVGGGLTWAKAKLKSIHGIIESAWKRTGRYLTLDVTIPANTTARIYVPGSGSEIRESGPTSGETLPGSIANGDEKIFEVGSGSYHFTSKLP